MKLTKRDLLKTLSKAAAIALFSTKATFSFADGISAKLDAWLMENSLGSHATGQENWDEIVAAAKDVTSAWS